MLKSVSFNTLYQLLGRYSLSISSFLISILVIKSLGSGYWGDYSIVLNFVSLFYIFADFGTNLYFAKSFAEDEEHARKHFSKILAYKLVLGLALILLSGIILSFTPYSSEIKSAALWALPVILLFSLINSTNLIFQSRLTYRKQLLINVVWAFSSFILTWFYITFSSTYSLSKLIEIYFVSSLLAGAVALYQVKEFLNWKTAWDTKYFKFIFMSSLLIGISTLLNSLMFSSDKFILSLYSDNTSVGTYTLAYKLFEIFLVFPTFVTNAFYPMLVSLKQESHENFTKSLRKVMSYNLILWLISAPVLLLVGYFIIPLIWGMEMRPAWGPFAILVAGSLPFFITATLNWVAVLENRSRMLIGIYFAGFAVNLGLNYFMIPQWDYIGAAISTNITELVVLFAFYLGLKKVIKG